MDLTFYQEVQLKIIESGILALALALVGYWINRSLEKFKKQ